MSIQESAAELRAIAEAVPLGPAEQSKSDLDALQGRIHNAMGDTARAGEVMGAWELASQRAAEYTAALHHLYEQLDAAASYHQGG